MKSELRSNWTDTVSNRNKTEIDSDQSAVRSAIGEGQRSRNMIIFGLKEERDNNNNLNLFSFLIYFLILTVFLTLETG